MAILPARWTWRVMEMTGVAVVAVVGGDGRRRRRGL
jgi:predicted polyphosphate/ATP-dependent NAD kinase